MDTLPRFTATRALNRLDIVVLHDASQYYFRQYLLTHCLPQCSGGQVCKEDQFTGGPFRYPARCCGALEIACQGTCRPWCDPTKRFFQRTTCDCECNASPTSNPPAPCPPPWQYDYASCICACPTTPCPPPRIRNPSTCACECPPAPWAECNGICRNLSTSKTNCGSCGNVCNQGEDCCDGVCTPLDTCSDCGFCGNACASDEGCCNRARRKLNTTQNCGTYDSGCGVKCDTGEICQAEECVCPSGRVKCGTICCPTGQRCCNGVCTDVKKSKQHCGACNMPVPQGWDCCNGIPIDTRSDKQHCGGCNKPISATQIAMGFECCNRVPVNTQGNNVLNCGGCGQACAGGVSCNVTGNVTVCTNYAAACQNGQCVCPSGRYACGTFCAQNAYPVCCGFPDPQTGRGWACPAGKTCSSMGTCI